MRAVLSQMSWLLFHGDIIRTPNPIDMYWSPSSMKNYKVYGWN